VGGGHIGESATLILAILVGMDDEYVEYPCSAYKKAIKSQVVICKKCETFLPSGMCKYT